MDILIKTSAWIRRQRNKYTLLACLLFACPGYSQTLFMTSDEVGVSKIDSDGMMSKIEWTKSKVKVLLNTMKYSMHVFLTNASRSQVYNEVTLLKKVETEVAVIRTYSAIDLHGEGCIVVLARNKIYGKEEQLRIYLKNEVYIFNFLLD